MAKKRINKPKLSIKHESYKEKTNFKFNPNPLFCQTLVIASLRALKIDFIMEMNRTEQNYKIAERAEEAIKKHGTIEKAITYLKSELKSFEDSWSIFSSDCLGHGITCNRLLISWLERKRSNGL